MAVTFDLTGAMSRGDAPPTAAPQTQNAPLVELTQGTRTEGTRTVASHGGVTEPAGREGELAFSSGTPASGSVEALGLVLSAAALSRTFGARSARSVDGPEEEWVRNNRRRVYLITRELNVGLTAREEAELVRLQDAMDRQLDAVAPLPREALDEFERRAREILGG